MTSLKKFQTKGTISFFPHNFFMCQPQKFRTFIRFFNFMYSTPNCCFPKKVQIFAFIAHPMANMAKIHIFSLNTNTNFQSETLVARVAHITHSTPLNLKQKSKIFAVYSFSFLPKIGLVAPKNKH